MKRLSPFLLIALLGLVFIIPSSSSWSAGTLKVTTPNGSESWTTGKKYTIKWDKGNAGAFVKIELLKSGKAYKTIKTRTKNDGRHRWKVPSSVKTGSAYKIKVTSVSKKTVKDQSDKNFTITKASTTTTGGGGDTLKVTSPDGGESWTTGKRYTIKWDKGDGKGTVKLELLKSGKAYKTIKTRTKNDGKHRWKVPTSVATGSAYKIKVTSTTDSSNTDSSDSNFTITKASSTTTGGGDTLKIVAPNGTEVLTRGMMVPIRWDKGDGKVKIELLEGGQGVLTVTASAPNDGAFDWTIPSTLATGSNYKIRITSTTDSSNTDSSDSNFTITE